MIIYNVTSKVDWSIEEDWVQWMKEEHMPEVVATGCFTNCQLLRILEIDEEEGPTYAAQYFAENKLQQELYIDQYAPTLREKVFDRWANRVLSFRTIMQVIN